MTITQLHYVLAIAEYKNFTKAADYCHVTQPTLSTQVQKLEDELGVKIFDRTQKPLQLTEVGKKIVTQAKKIVIESERIQDIVEQQKGFIGGDFKLAIIPTVMPTLLPMFLKNFSSKYPKVKLQIQELTTDDVITALEKGEIDAAIAATPLDNELLKERVIYFEPFVAYIPNAHHLHGNNKISMKDLDLNDILLLEDGHCFRDSVINLCHNRSQKDLKFKVQSGSFETLIKLANEGLGMTLLPYLNTLDLNEQFKTNVFEFEAPKPSREISLIYSTNQLKLHIIEALYQSISGIIRGAITFEDVKIISPLKNAAL